MSKVMADISMSLDGIVTQPNPGGETPWVMTLAGSTIGCSTRRLPPTPRSSTRSTRAPERS